MEETIFDILKSVGPAIVVGVIAYYFFDRFIDNEDKRRKFLLVKDVKKSTIPITLQAYERLALFLERISPAQLLVRVKPTSQDKQVYSRLLNQQIEQEFEHNLSQQIYITQECWNVIKSSKNAMVKLIRTAGENENIKSADQLREFILQQTVEKPAPSSVALEYLKNEVKMVLG